MLFSRSCEYALRAALYLADRPPGTFAPVRAVSEALAIPHAFLAKLVRTLEREGLFVTSAGKGGGVALARPAERIALAEVVRAVEGPGWFEGCVLRLPGCGEQAPCPLHEAWVPVRAHLARIFRETTLDVARLEGGRLVST